MSIPICTLSDCDIMASARCLDCEDTFCVRHISSTPPLICDGCRDARAERWAQGAQARASARRFKYLASAGVCALVGAGVGWVLAVHPLWSIVQGVVIGAIIGAVFGLLCILGDEMQYISE